VPSDEEVARRKVRRIVDTLKELAAKLTTAERAEYEAMAQGILDDADKLAIIGYLLKTHFEEDAKRGVLDEGAGAGEEDLISPAAYAPEAHSHDGGGRHASHGGHGSGGHSSGGHGGSAHGSGGHGGSAHGSGGSGGPGQGGGPAGAPGTGRRRRRRRRRGGGGPGGGGSGGGS